MARKDVATTLEEDLYIAIKILATKQGKYANDLIEEGMKYILDKNGVAYDNR